MDGIIICFVDYSQEYLEIVQFSRLATLRHFMNSDCFLCYYNLLLQSLWKDIHLFFLPNCVSFIVDWYQRLRCFWQMTHRHRYWKIRSKSISLALQKFRIKVDVIANLDRPYNRKMHLWPYQRGYAFFTVMEKCNRHTFVIMKYLNNLNV